MKATPTDSAEIKADPAEAQSGVTRLLQQAVAREPFVDHGGFSGSTLERVTLADGRHLVIKHFSQELDYIMRATQDEGRAAFLFTSGILAPVADVIDDTILAVEPEGSGWVMAMRDVQANLVRHHRLTRRADSLRVLRAAAKLYETFWGQHIDGMVRLEDWFMFLTPEVADRVGRVGAVRAHQQWECLVERAPADVMRALSAIAERPELLCDELDRCHKTLIHGDLKLDNAGFTSDRVILIDWALACLAPPEVDFGTYLFSSALRIDASPDDLLDDIRGILGARFQPRALELALIGGLLQRGPIMAHAATGERPDRDPQRAEAFCDWAIRRVSRALEVWSPI